MKRTLTLQRETLTALTGDEMAAVAGAGWASFPQCHVAQIKAAVEAATEEIHLTRTCTI